MSPETSRARALYFHRLAFRVGLAAGNIFAWILVFRVLFVATESMETALAGTALLYALSQVIAFILTPLTGAALRHGVRRALVYGTLAAAASFGMLSVLFLSGSLPRDQVFLLIAFFVLLQGMYRALYWVPYRTEEARIFTRSPFGLLSDGVIALIPALSGYMLATFMGGPFVVCVGVAILLFVSAIPLLRLEGTPEPYEWSYGETFRQLFARQNSGAVGLFIFDGIQGATLLLIWPLAAFLILSQSFQSLGAILTATLCVTFLGRWVMRHVFRKLRIAHSPMIAATIVFSSWIIRFTAGTPIQLLVAEVYYNSASSPRRFSIDSYAHEQTADGGHFVDEFTAIKEMSLSIGRIAVCILFAVLALYTAEILAFAAVILLAALSGAASVFLGARLDKTAF